MIHFEEHDSVAVLRVEHGKVNALDAELSEALMAELERLEKSAASAVVLTGTGKAFSAGVDLFRILDGGSNYVERFLPSLAATLEKLFLFPKPVVAAINGHAIAGGCVVAGACDYRIMAQGAATIGLPELLVGVPFPALALEIVRFGCAPQHLQEILYTGCAYSAEQGLQRGLVDEIVAADTLLNRACEMAASLGAIPPKSFQLVKHQLRQPVIDRVKQSARERAVLDVWNAPEIHSVIRQYLQKTIGKK